ncbi:small GTP-binding protein [Tritrichomonas foetus]|uniref:Small GTP-binding protein n=1 Tax=Tritrichomonas foetus TaxID=1144522 RepID=A0A1J4KSB8_9EUKA|nr:small GTP-binding protein [Tritrichomonas foetus]|eukprot:OHT12708.1 small GTP-binding protein [Tritrichomonas foetus]
MMQRRVSNLDLKIVVLGSAYVGKTSLINRYCNGTFIENTRSTIGAGFFTHSLNIEDSEVTVMLWDTAGEERFRSVAPSLLRGANGLILVFDLTSPDSFNDIDIYMDMFLDTCRVDPNQNPPVLLLGNKCDIDVEQQKVTTEMIEKWKAKNHVSLFHNVSAKDGTNVENAFEEFVRSLVTPQTSSENSPIQIVIAQNTEKKNKGCC